MEKSSSIDLAALIPSEIPLFFKNEQIQKLKCKLALE